MATTVTTKTEPKNIYKRMAVWAAVIAAVLMIPLLTNAPWTGSDYVFSGTVLFFIALGYELATRNVADRFQRLAVAAACAGVIVLILGWAASGP